MLLGMLNIVAVRPPPPASAAAASGDADTDASSNASNARLEPAASDAAVLEHVNAELLRAAQTRWRRLIPSQRSAEYLPLFESEEERHINGLAFAVEDEREEAREAEGRDGSEAA